MKKNRFLLLMLFIGALFAVFLSSCEEKITPDPDPEPVVTYTVDLVIDGEGAATVKDLDGTDVVSTEVETGTQLIVRTTPSENWRLLSKNVASAFYLTSDTTVRVVFEEIPLYTVSFEQPEEGSIIVRNGEEEVQSGASFRDGTSLSVEIVAANEYYFLGSNIANGLSVHASFKLSQDTTIIPSFEMVTQTTHTNTHIMATYNIRYWNGGSETSPKEWPLRKASVFQVIEDYAFDVAGIEEVTSLQSPDIITVLPDYEYIGYGRDNGKENLASASGEQTGLIYRKSRYVKIDQGRFFMSSSPSSPSKVSGATFNRMVTWVKLKERSSEQEFYYFATHFAHHTDATGIRVRGEEAVIAIEQIDLIVGEQDIPTIFVGDFNCEPDEIAHETLSAKWSEAFELIGEQALGGYPCSEAQRLAFCDDTQPEVVCLCDEPGNTYTGLYSSSDTEPKRIDYLWIDPLKVQVNAYNAMNDNYGLEFYPSDHMPIITEMEFLQ